jgi:hypothetical protein
MQVKVAKLVIVSHDDLAEFVSKAKESGAVAVTLNADATHAVVAVSVERARKDAEPEPKKEGE